MTAEELTALEHSTYPAPDAYGLSLTGSPEDAPRGGRFGKPVAKTVKEPTALEHHPSRSHHYNVDHSWRYLDGTNGRAGAGCDARSRR